MYAHLPSLWFAWIFIRGSGTTRPECVLSTRLFETAKKVYNKIIQPSKKQCAHVPTRQIIFPFFVSIAFSLLLLSYGYRSNISSPRDLFGNEEVTTQHTQVKS
ncbi:hypothetical protein BU16DRAFT_531168 [Lophium mytilinum]|uniref:Uncharacterized protein n=1 Tax=Lophium mytilinum TaxID=390894 RepID=A0A6A6QBK4_9PEZI|nr:hypothetical protein BU16DRAFT_531168 [Lophium mytilinum]